VGTQSADETQQDDGQCAFHDLGAAGAKLTLYEPAAVVLQRGGTAKTDIKIARNSLPGDVKTRLTGVLRTLLSERGLTK